MAIVFTTSLPEDRVLNAYNNNVIEFYSDSELTTIKAVITVDDIPFEGTPSPSGSFYFNFQSIVKTLMNTNNFADTIEPENENTMVYPDDTLYREFAINISVQFEDGTTDQDAINLKFIKAADQEETYKRNLLNSQNSTIALLLPFIPESTQDYHATYFEGYPFDVSLYSNENRNVTITNVATGVSSDFELTQGVNRIFFSDGDNNFSVDEIIPLQIGKNLLSIASDDKIIYLNLIKVDSKCGTYFKFFNDQGGWSYFLFTKFDETITTKDNDSFYQDFQNLNSITDRFFDMGVSVDYENKYFAVDINQNQMQLVKSLKESSRVYRYLNKLFQTSKRTDWITDKIKPGKLRTFNRTRITYDVIIETENIKQNKVMY
tara:strand:- start:17780 stop:18907 length:1128 start_codon:yes stop_codon:yes gene_type:complete